MCIGYYIGARVGFALTLHPVPVSTLWPPNSILLAALLLAPTRWWWALILAALPAHLLAELGTGIPPAMVLSWFVSNSAEALIGAAGVRLFLKGPLLLDDIKQVAVFLVFPTFLGPFLSSFLDAWFVGLNQFGQSTYWEVWQSRFASNVVAAVTLVPLIVIVGTRGRDLVRNVNGRRWLEFGVLTLALIAVCALVFVHEPAGLRSVPALLYAPLPMLLWSAVRFGPAGASGSFLIFALFAIGGATRGLGPFVTSSPQANALAMQQFLIISAVPVLTLAAVVRERARAEGRARWDEERLRLALSAAQMGTWEWDIPAKRGIWSDTTRRMFGLPSGTELTLRRLLSLVVPEDRPGLALQMRRASHPEGLYETEFRIARPDRTVRWLRASAIALANGDGVSRRLLGVTADITEEKDVLDAIQESETRFRSVFEMGVIPMAFWHTDGRITDANDAYLRLTGYSRSELESGDLHWDRLTAPEFRHLDEKAVHELKTRGHCTPYEKEYVLRDGRRVPIQTGAGLIGNGKGICVEMDLTARKRVERELESRLRFEQLVSDLSATFATERDTRAEDQIPPWLGRLGEFLDVPWVSVSQLARNQRSPPSWPPPGPRRASRPFPRPCGSGSSPPSETPSSAAGRLPSRTASTPRDPPSSTRPALPAGDRRPAGRPAGRQRQGVRGADFVGAGARRWPPELVLRLRLIGEIFSNALARKASRATATGRSGERRDPRFAPGHDRDPGSGRQDRSGERGLEPVRTRPSNPVRHRRRRGRPGEDVPPAAARQPLAQEVSAGLEAVMSGDRHDFSLTFPLFNGDNGEANWQEMLVHRLARREGARSSRGWTARRESGPSWSPSGTGRSWRMSSGLRRWAS